MILATLQDRISDYQHWRETLSQSIADYRNWLNATNTIQPIQELRLIDLQEMLQKDQLVLAFLAEYSRGKTETINALFFSDFKQRLLPSEPGRTTMSPTEIFWDSREEPCIKLLPIETRVSNDGLMYLKTTPEAWHKFRLNLNSPDSMREVLRTLTQQKEVSKDEAIHLGLWDESDMEMFSNFTSTGHVKIPMWRHALINYPHPLLKSGLVIIDTPGLNSLGTEPELTLNIISKAQVVLFMTAVDTGITKSDMRIWNDYICERNSHKVVILNKIDTLWDDIRTPKEINQLIDIQIQTTAKTLGILPSNVFAMSAQKALTAKFNADEKLLEKSRIQDLEEMIVQELIVSKQEMLSKTIANECREMLKTSRKFAHVQIENIRVELYELENTQDKTRVESKKMLAKVVADRKRYVSSEQTFNLGSEKIRKLGDRMLRHLSIAHLELTVRESRKQIGDSWTTISLNRGMRSLAKETYLLATTIIEESKTIKKMADELYRLFQVKHGFQAFEAPVLNMTNFINSMQALEKTTDEFCTNPINIMTEKHFLIRRFFTGIGAQAQTIFETAHKDCSIWLNSVLNLLSMQIEVHRISLERRTQTLMQAHANADQQSSTILRLQQELSLLQSQKNALDTMMLKILQSAKESESTAAHIKSEEMRVDDMLASDDSLGFSDAPLLDLSHVSTASHIKH